jgi:tape measure domain-containing protein
MADIITYTIDLQDKISSKLKIIGINNEKQLDTWAKVQQQVNSANGTMNQMGRSIGSLTERINALKAQKEWIPAQNHAAIRATNHEIQRLEAEITKLNNLDGGKFKKWFGDIKNSIPAFVNPITAIGAGLGYSIKQGMENELQKTNITTLLNGDSVKADKLFADISQYGKDTVYDKAGLIDAQKTMLAFGLSSDFAFSKLKEIGDIAMGDKQKMQSLSLAFSQAQSTGKLMGQDLLQMINAGFNPLETISERTGESIASLKKRMSEGKISTDELSQAFSWATDEQGRFYQGAEKAGQTFAGKMAKLQDTIAEFAISVYSAIEPIISPVINLTTKLFEAIGNGFNWLLNAIKTGNPVVLSFAGAIGAITAAIIIYNTWQQITAAWTSIVTIFKSGEAAAWWAATVPMLITVGIITGIIVVIAALVAAIVYCVKCTTGWGETWKNIMAWMRLGFDVFVESLKLGWNAIKEYYLTGFDLIRAGWYKLQSLWDKDAADAGLNKIREERDARAKERADSVGKMKELSQKMKEMDVWAVKGNGKSLSDVFGGAKKKLGLGGLDTGATTGGNINSLNNTLTSGTESIATGGQRNTTINIQIGDMVREMNFNGSLGDNKQNVTDNLKEVLAEVLGMAELAA